MDLISIIVPCYNEEASLKLFYSEMDKVSKMMDFVDFEFLLVDDGSKDETLEEIKRLSSADIRVKYISFSRNFGKEAAIYAGLQNAKGDFVAIMDADLQDPPSLLPEMYQILAEGKYDSVGTRRVTRKGEPPVRSFFAKCFYKLINRISDADIVDGARDYRLMNRKFVDALLSMSEYNRFSKGLFGWVGFKTKWLEFENVERVAGGTKWSFWSLFKYSVEGIVAFSTVPLMLSFLAGILFCFGSLIVGVVLAVLGLVFDINVSGWAIAVDIISFIAGVQFMFMGIIGLYLSKTYSETKKRPVYIIAETNGDGKQTSK